MILCVENEAGYSFGFDPEALALQAASVALERAGCPFAVRLDLILTDDSAIREMNRMHRGIDDATDVLSFPAFTFPAPADFDAVSEEAAYAVDRDTDTVWLGDIVISAERCEAQALAFGHSLQREFAFLVVHSVLHLIGYDHVTPGQAQVMEREQEQALEAIGLGRGEEGLA